MSKICNHCLLALDKSEYSDAEREKPAGVCRTCEQLPPMVHVEDAVEEMMRRQYGKHVCAGCGG